MQQILELAKSPVVIGAAVSAVLGLLGLFAAKWSDQRKRRVALAVYHAYHIALDVAEEEPGEGAPEFAAAVLDKADEWMASHGWRPLKPGEQDRATLMVSSLNGQAKVAAKASP